MKLKKVTPGAIAVLKKHGLLDFKKSAVENLENTYSVYADPGAVEEIARAIFDEDFADTKWEDFDLAVLARGIQDFFGQLQKPVKT